MGQISAITSTPLKENHLLKIGLTGGIAAGKTVVGEMLARLGAHLIQADAVSHELMQPGQPVYEEVVRRFGQGILDRDGRVNRPRLAQAAFGNPATGVAPRVKELNEIVHPAVVERENRWMEEVGKKHPDAVAIVEAALILEAGVADRFDRLIVVTCRPEQRTQRFARRLGISEDAAGAEVARRMAAQIPDEEKIKAADYVIDNSGPLEHTEEQVRKIWAELQRLVRAQSPR